jgi:hypothetical protein
LAYENEELGFAWIQTIPRAAKRREALQDVGEAGSPHW